MDKAYNSAIAIATALVQHDSTLSFTVEDYDSKRCGFRLVISRNDERIVMISFSEHLGYFGVYAQQFEYLIGNRNYNDVKFEAKDSDKMLTYIFNILEAYKVVAQVFLGMSPTQCEVDTCEEQEKGDYYVRSHSV